MPESEFHNGISRELGGIQVTLDAMHEQLKGMKEQMTIANGRTRKLEDWKLVVKTQTGVIAALVSGLVGAIVWGLDYFSK